jgi:hypothetical protein
VLVTRYDVPAAVAKLITPELLVNDIREFFRPLRGKRG